MQAKSHNMSEYRDSMANNKQPIAKKSRYLGISPAVMLLYLLL